MKNTFKLKFSNNIIEHLGVKLYQNKVTKVISEYIANGWDAGANIVNIFVDNNYIAVIDNGSGMGCEDIQNKFLVIG